MTQRPGSRGFTLIEILVALAVVAVALAAGSQATGALTRAAARQKAGRTLQVTLSVVPTPNPNFRRVDALVESRVEGVDVRLLSLSTIMGRY